MYITRKHTYLMVSFPGQPGLMHVHDHMHVNRRQPR